MDLMANNSHLDKSEIQNIVKEIYQNEEPILRVDEMQKFFYGHVIFDPTGGNRLNDLCIVLVVVVHQGGND